MTKKKIRARKLDILEFIMRKRLIQPYELRDKFRYTHQAAYDRLSRLKKAGLVINMTRGFWELTEEGYRKLRFFGRR